MKEIIIIQNKDFCSIKINNNLICSCNTYKELLKRFFIILKSFNGNQVQLFIKKWWIIDLEEFPQSFDWDEEKINSGIEIILFNEDQQNIKDIFKIFMNTFKIPYSKYHE